MLAYVLNIHNKALMPCHAGKARLLLKEKKAQVIQTKPFTIRLLYGSAGYKQEITVGIDSGYSHIGICANTKEKAVFSAEIELRDDVVKLNAERKQYRRTKRNRKTWYRKKRFLNRKKGKNWLAPSIQHKLDSHIRFIEKVQKILPISDIIVEVANFDIQKIKNPKIRGSEYQKGEQKDFWNVREYVLYRDNHTCQHCHGSSKDSILEVHHLKTRQTGGNRPRNLITLCSTCHTAVSQGKISLNAKPAPGFKATTFMTTIRKRLVTALKRKRIRVAVTYGYITKSKRIALGLCKSHVNDAFVIANGQHQDQPTLFLVTQNRRHNRCLQMNRKGFKPSIRKKRYAYHPGDLVLCENKIFTVKGMFNYGKWIRLANSVGKISNVKVDQVKILKYQRGFVFV